MNYFEAHPALSIFIGLLITVLLPYLKHISFQKFEKRKIGIQQIDLADQVMNSNINRASKKQKFLTEQVFESIYGKQFNYDQILALINMNNSSQAIHYFVNSGNYTELSKTKDSFLIKEEFKDTRREQLKSFFQYFASMIFGLSLLGLAGLLYSNSTSFSWKYFFPALLTFFAGVFILIGLKTLSDIDQIKFAEKLEKEIKT